MPSPPEIEQAVEHFREQLLQNERAAAVEMVQAYGEAWRRIEGELEILLEQITQAREAGEVVSVAWLLQRERLYTLLSAVRGEVDRLMPLAEGLIISQQREAVQAGVAHAEELLLTGLGEAPPGVVVTFARPPLDALGNLVGVLQDGSPLRDLLAELGPELEELVKNELIRGVAIGDNPREIARRIRSAFGGRMVRALRIARTEVLRAYREAALLSYRANRDVVKGWIWHSALGTRTCAVCWAMHGTFHTLDETLGDHPNGRCVMVPVTKSWAELGIPGVPETSIIGRIPLGPEVFEALDEEEQKRILGPAAFRAYKDGSLSLNDLVAWRSSPRWGRMVARRSLREVLHAVQ